MSGVNAFYFKEPGQAEVSPTQREQSLRYLLKREWHISVNFLVFVLVLLEWELVKKNLAEGSEAHQSSTASFQAPTSFPLTERQFIKRTPRPLRTPAGRHAIIPTSRSGYTRI